MACIIQAIAQPQEVYFHEFLPIKELANQKANCILKDQKGILWIGTFSGLYQYDGLEVNHYIHKAEDPNSILNNNVSGLVEDNYGQIWIITESGLSCLNPKDGKFYSWRDENFRQLYKNAHGDILAVARKGNKIFTIRPQEFQKDSLNKQILVSRPRPVPGNKRLNFLTVLEDSSKKLWIGCDKGLYFFEYGEGLELVKSSMPITVLCLSQNQEEIWAGLAGPTIMSLPISGDLKNVNWDQKIVLDEKSRVNVNDLLIDGQNSMWVASSNGLYQVSKLDSPRKKSTHLYRADESKLGALPSSTIQSIYQDDNMNLWFGTLQGVRQVRKHPFLFEHIKLELDDYVPLNQIIAEVFYDKLGRTWVGTENDGLFCRPSDQANFQKVPLPGSRCDEILMTSDGSLLAAIGESLWVLPAGMSAEMAMETDNWKLLAKERNSIRSIVEPKPGLIWLGLWREGVVAYNLTDGQRQKAPLEIQKSSNPEFHVEAFLKDSKGNIWVGTRGYGLYVLSISGEILRFHDLGAEKGKIAYGVLTLFEDSKGQVWVGTRGGGLLCFESGLENYQSFTTKEGLPFNTVCSVLEDNYERVWVSTENGLAMYLPDEPIPFAFFNREDGLLNSHFDFNSASKKADGSLFFGSKNGLYKIKPRPFHVQRATSRMIVNKIQVMKGGKTPEQSQVNELNLESRLGTGILKLDFSERSFDIHFTTLNFTNPSKIRYAYRLEGLENDWTYVLDGENLARYIEVRSGTYRFQLKCSDALGRWNDEVLNIPIEISPPFWRTQSAFILFAILGILLLLGLILLISRWEYLRKRLRVASQEQARQHTSLSYFSDISHEIRNRLTLILGPLESLLSSEGEDIPIEVLQRVYRNAHRLKLLTDEIMNLRKGDLGTFTLKVGRGDIRQFFLRIKQDMGEIARLRQVRFYFEAEDEELLAWFDQQLVEIITLNLLSNAFKYTPEAGEVVLALGTEVLDGEEGNNRDLPIGEYIKFEVRDTGKGISGEDLRRIFEPYYQSEITKKDAVEGTGLGLDLVARLVQLHHGAIIAQSQPGKETVITCWIPREMNMYKDEELQIAEIERKEELGNQHGAALIGPEGDKALILIAEDDKDLRQMLAQSLMGEFQILQAENGVQGFELVEEYKPDLILSDLIMPDGDGLTFLKKLRADKALNHIPFIILTARYSESQRLACIQHQANDFIEKPFRMDFLKWKIRSILLSRERLRMKYSRMGKAEPREVNVKSSEDQFIESVVELMEKHIASAWLSVDFLASEMNMSRATFYRRMEGIMNDSPSNFIKQFRLKRATQLLQSKRYNISEVSHHTGFKNPRYFSKCFQREFGVSPSAYLKQLAVQEQSDPQL